MKKPKVELYYKSGFAPMYTYNRVHLSIDKNIEN